eukprot:3835622-Amphidinium_carterae.1
MLFLSIEEPRLTGILKQLQTIRQPDANVIKGESHALVQSLIHTACGYEARRQLNIQLFSTMQVQWQGNVLHSDSSCHPLGVITTVQGDAQALHSVASDNSGV